MPYGERRGLYHAYATRENRLENNMLIRQRHSGIGAVQNYSIDRVLNSIKSRSLFEAGDGASSWFTRPSLENPASHRYAKARRAPSGSAESMVRRGGSGTEECSSAAESVRRPSESLIQPKLRRCSAGAPRSDRAVIRRGGRADC